MDFKKVEAEDIKILKKFFSVQNSRMSDYSGGAVYIWAKYLGTQYCVENDTLFMRFHDSRHEHDVYAYPVASGDIRVAIDRIIENIAGAHKPVFVAVPEAALEKLAEHYEIEYKFKPKWSDYLYDGEAFRSFAGKKFHAKRNHISKFIRTYGGYVYEPITNDNLPDVYALLDEYTKAGEETALSQYEYQKNVEVVGMQDKLGLTGGLIRTAGKVVGIAVGETVGDTLFVHIEKALRGYDGAYTVIANEFAKQFPSVAFINREDDAGDEGLRKSKLSYNPLGLVNKYTVEIISRKKDE